MQRMTASMFLPITGQLELVWRGSGSGCSCRSQVPSTRRKIRLHHYANQARKIDSPFPAQLHPSDTCIGSQIVDFPRAKQPRIHFDVVFNPATLCVTVATV